MSKSITYVGLGVHKDSIVIALAGMKDHYCEMSDNISNRGVGIFVSQVSKIDDTLRV